MNDPLSQIRTGSQLERKEIENVDDTISNREEQDAKSKKVRTASERAQNFEEQYIKDLKEQVSFLQDRICLNENLPAKVAQLEQCLDGFRAIGWAQVVITMAGTIAVGISGVVATSTGKWIWFGVGATCLIVTEGYRVVSQFFALPRKHDPNQTAK